MHPQTSARTPIEIIKPQGFYMIKNVWLPYANKCLDVQVTSQLLNDGKRGTQVELAKTGWLGSARLITAVLASLYEDRGADGVGELKRLFAEDFRMQLMMTGTRVTYRSGGRLDLVTHDVGTPVESTLEARLVGPNDYVSSRIGDVTQALLGSNDTGRIVEVYQWVTGEAPKLFRVNEQPNQDSEHALVLGLIHFFDVNATGDVNYGRPARGVRIARRKLQN